MAWKILTTTTEILIVIPEILITPEILTMTPEILCLFRGYRKCTPHRLLLALLSALVPCPCKTVVAAPTIWHGTTKPRHQGKTPRLIGKAPRNQDTKNDSAELGEDRDRHHVPDFARFAVNPLPQALNPVLERVP